MDRRGTEEVACLGPHVPHLWHHDYHVWSFQYWVVQPGEGTKYSGAMIP